MRDDYKEDVIGFDVHAHEAEELNSRLITDPVKAKSLILGGNAYITIKSLKSQTHFTFRVKKAKPKDDRPLVYFVNVRTGPTDDGIWQFMGLIDATGNYAVAKKHAYRLSTSASNKAFDWFWRHLNERKHIPPQVELRHEGRCCRCGRRLTDPESIDRGIGPECYNKV